MTLTLNGKSEPFPDRLTLAGLLELRNVKPGQVVVEVNGAIPDKTRFHATTLSNGDRVEILQFVGGG